MIELALLMKGASLSLSLASYAGIIHDKLKLKVEQLAGSELEAGVRALQQAAGSEREQLHLLREARSRFNKAISLEDGFRLASANLGLALCHIRLGDAANAKKAIEELVQVAPPNASMLLKAGRFIHKKSWKEIGVYAFPLIAHVAVAKLVAPVAEARLVAHEASVAKLVELQQEAQRLLEQSHRDGCESVFGLTTRGT